MRQGWRNPSGTPMRRRTKKTHECIHKMQHSLTSFAAPWTPNAPEAAPPVVMPIVPARVPAPVPVHSNKRKVTLQQGNIKMPVILECHSAGVFRIAVKAQQYITVTTSLNTGQYLIYPTSVDRAAKFRIDPLGIRWIPSQPIDYAVYVVLTDSTSLPRAYSRPLSCQNGPCAIAPPPRVNVLWGSERKC